jgi:GAF domain-containing protein
MGHAGVVARTAQAARTAASFEELGNRVADELGCVVPLDRMNIGLIDPESYIFTDVYVTGRNVQGRTVGHRRTLADTVVEAGMNAGGGIVIGDEPPARLAEHFPRLQSTHTGIRSMLTVTLESECETVAALVLASTCQSAYTNDDLEMVRGVGAAIVDRIVALRNDL